jgi:hypothetical protein
MDEESIYVYVCGIHSSVNSHWIDHILGIYRNEKDAINKIIYSCKYEYPSIRFYKQQELNFESITSYDQVDKFMKKYCMDYYNNESYYLYIERVKLE